MAGQDEQGRVARVARENYISRDFLLREKENLWPRVWQVACRAEELKKPGDYVVYDIADESIIVARNKQGALVAYHNVCPHRGRQLAEGCGHISQYRCKFHNWAFDLDGRNIFVQDRDDWEGALDGQRLDLHHVKVDTWGGFVFINMNPECETLLDFLETVPEYLGPYEFENMRYRWYKTVKLNCNWKVALEAFVEGYHVAATHPQLLDIQGDDYSEGFAHGKHSSFSVGHRAVIGQHSPRVKAEPRKDARDGIMKFFADYEVQLKAMFTDRHNEIVQKMKEITPPTASPLEALGIAVELGRQAAEADGCGFPEKLTFEHMAKVGADWTIFPNCATLPWFDGAIWYRSRPDGDDPDRCVFDIFSLKRYGEGKEPPLERIAYNSIEEAEVGLILEQDISNMMHVQRGMKSRVFKGAIMNPRQETPVLNQHRTIEQYVLGQARS